MSLSPKRSKVMRMHRGDNQYLKRPARDSRVGLKGAIKSDIELFDLKRKVHAVRVDKSTNL